MIINYYMARDKVRLKPVFSPTETSQTTEISIVAGLDMILSNKWITKVCTFVVFQTPEDSFSRVQAQL